MTTEPRTEAGRALLGWARMANPYRPHRADEIRDAILAIETEAAAGPRDWGKGYVPGTGANEAAAGPRDEGLRKAVVLALADLRHAGGGPRVDAAYERLSAALVKASE